MISTINGKDLVILFMYAPGGTDEINEPIVGRTRLMKMVFLFEKELKKDFLKNEDAVIFEFVAYLFGPYSHEEMKDLNFLISAQFVLEQDTAIPVSNVEDAEKQKYETDEYIYDLWDEVENVYKEVDVYERKYLLSEKGVRYAKEKIWSALDENQRSLIMRFKTQITKMPLDDLLRYVYQKYPEFTTNSKIKEKYL